MQRVTRKDWQEHHFVKPDDVESALSAIILIAERILNHLSDDGGSRSNGA